MPLWLASMMEWQNKNVKSDPGVYGFKRIFNHCLDTILSKDDNSLDRPTLVANVKNILLKIDTVKQVWTCKINAYVIIIYLQSLISTKYSWRDQSINRLESIKTIIELQLSCAAGFLIYFHLYFLFYSFFVLWFQLGQVFVFLTFFAIFFCLFN